MNKPEYYYLQNKFTTDVIEDAASLTPKFFHSKQEAEDFRLEMEDFDEWETRQFSFDLERGDQ